MQVPEDAQFPQFVELCLLSRADGQSYFTRVSARGLCVFLNNMFHGRYGSDVEHNYTTKRHITPQMTPNHAFSVRERSSLSNRATGVIART